MKQMKFGNTALTPSSYKLSNIPLIHFSQKQIEIK